ncbi:methionyl-tRNA formyltransferase [Salibacterium salarium]|uniref:Methionyl-tRNA formyltransferase n=1 Tax=Salibacterium salarium TaxID=284579 RepID=A0A3R9P6C3_9BACI|nr:methionyl-tRNA formyltransferase [Salibacterium salarium]RSL31277.1 methionyl-tRNA formyltransferase [Salibacterium salarium]
MKIVFMGTPDFSVPILKGLVDAGYQIEAVVTQPDRPKGRKKIMTPPPVKEEANKHGLTVLQPETLKIEENVDAILDKQPDVIITAAFGQILPVRLLEAPTFGAINVHASLLPKYRGGAPIHQAVIDGEEKTGITIMYMVKELDAGDMLAKRELPIADDETTGSLHDSLSVIGRELLLDTLPLVKQNEIEPVPQNPEEATFARNIGRGQEQIDWNKPGKTIYNQIRGMNPWPVAYTNYGGKVFKIWKAKKQELKSSRLSEPGTILSIGDQDIVVATADNTAIEITELQPAGKKRMTAADYLRGSHELQTGESFTNDKKNV